MQGVGSQIVAEIRLREWLSEHPEIEIEQLIIFLITGPIMRSDLITPTYYFEIHCAVPSNLKFVVNEDGTVRMKISACFTEPIIPAVEPKTTE